MEVKAQDGSLVEMHAHVCEACAKNGKNVMWMHAAEKGNIDAHKCPECGTVQWKQSHVPVASLPGQRARQAVAANMLPYRLFDFFMLTAFAALAVYWVLIAYEQYIKVGGGIGPGPGPKV